MSATTPEELLVQLLTTNATIGPLVGSRVYDTYLPEIDPAALYPAITYKVVSRPHLKTLAGNGGMYYPRYQVDVYSLRSSDIRTIARAVFGMEGVQSAAGGAVTLKWLWLEDEADDVEHPTQMDEQGVRRATLDLILWYTG